MWVESVEAMVRIIHEIERSRMGERQHVRGTAGAATPSVEDAIALATVDAAEMLQVPLIVCFTRSGFTPKKVSALRPGIPILALSTEASTCRHLALVWGVIPALAPHSDSYAQMFEVARREVLQRGLAKAGDRVLVTAGVPFDVPGTTNLMKVEVV